MHCKTRLNRPPPVSFSPANIPQVGHAIGPLVAVDMVQKCQWQSRGAYIAVNRHRSGLYVAVVQAYKRYRDGNKKEQKLVVNRHF